MTCATLIAEPAVFVLVVLVLETVAELIFVLVVDSVGDLTVVLVGLLVVESFAGGGGSSNAGALLNG